MNPLLSISLTLIACLFATELLCGCCDGVSEATTRKIGSSVYSTFHEMTYSNHVYLVSEGSGGSSLIHAEHCPCKNK